MLRHIAVCQLYFSHVLISILQPFTLCCLSINIIADLQHVFVGVFQLFVFITKFYPFVQYRVSSVCSLLCFRYVFIVVFQVHCYVSAMCSILCFSYVFLVFLLYAWSVLPFIYLLSFMFSVASTGYVWITVLNIFTGIQFYICLLRLLGNVF